MAHPAVRQGTTCPTRTSWYVCSRGSFRGCCSVDPCTTGICLDVTISSTTVISRTAPATLATSASSTTKPSITTDSGVVAPTASATTSISRSFTNFTGFTGFESSTSSTSATSTIFTTATTATSSEIPQPTAVTTDTSTESRRESNGGMIGGIAGGAVALLIIMCVIGYILYRRRKGRGKRFTLLRWRYGPNMEDGQIELERGKKRPDRPQSQSPPRPRPGPQPQTPSTITSSVVTATPRRQLPSIPEGQSLTLSTYPSPNQGHQTNSPQTLPSADSSTTSPNSGFSSISSISTISPSNTGVRLPSPSIPGQPESIHPALRQKGYLTTAYSTPNSSSTEITDSDSFTSTAELSDTGFYRGRLELPAESTRELINIPLETRLKQRQQQQQRQSRRPTGSPSPVITPEGAILKANFHNLPIGPDSHAMSFMNFDSGSNPRSPDCLPQCNTGRRVSNKRRERGRGGDHENAPQCRSIKPFD